MEHGWVRLNVPRPYVPFAKGGFPTPSGKCEFYSERMGEMGLDPLPAFTPPHEFPETAPELAARYPLTLISSPAHQFLNSTFVNVDSLRRGARAGSAHASARRRARGIATGMRGGRTTTAAHSPRSRASRTRSPGRGLGAVDLVGEVRGGRANANQTTSQRETDLGHGPVFYDNLVEVPGGLTRTE